MDRSTPILIPSHGRRWSEEKDEEDANVAAINGFAIGAHKISVLELERQHQTPATIRVVPNWTILVHPWP